MAREARKKKVEPAFTVHSRDRLSAMGEPLVGEHESVADLLRRTREQYGEDLMAVAEALRIRYVHLKAIEEGRFRDLPGSTYAIGFVRSYAEFLGLDGPELVERFKDEVEGLNRKTQLVFPTPVPEGKVPGGALILISVVLLAVAYGGWSYLSRTDTNIADLIPPVPEHLQSLSGDTEAVTAGGPGEDETGAVGTAAPSATPAATQAAAPEASENGLPASADGTATQQAAETTAAPAPAENRAVAEMAPNSGISENGPSGSEGSDSARATPATSEPLIGGPSQAQAAPSNEESSQTTLSQVDARGESPTADTAPPSTEAASPAEPLPGEANPSSTDSFDADADREIPAAPQLALGNAQREPQTYGADNEDARIVLRAMHDSWVQVRDAEDSLLLTRVLREGDSYRVPNREGLTLLTGNAGGIEILVDGRRLPPLGPIGAVRRDIVLDPQLLAQGQTTRQ